MSMEHNNPYRALSLSIESVDDVRPRVLPAILL